MIVTRLKGDDCLDRGSRLKLTSWGSKSPGACELTRRLDYKNRSGRKIVPHAQAMRYLFNPPLEADRVAWRRQNDRLPAISMVAAHSNIKSRHADSLVDQIRELSRRLQFLWAFLNSVVYGMP